MALKRFLLSSLALHSMLALWIFLVASQPRPTESISFEIYEKAPVATTRKTPVEHKNPDQIVEQDEKALNDETPEDVKYLSRHNQVVKKQTMAQKHGEFQNVAKSLSSPQAFQPSFDVAKMAREQAARDQKVEDGFLPAMEKKKETSASQHQAQQGQKSGGEVSQSNDYIKNLDPGLETLLSTKEFVFYTYFARIRQQLNQFWGPKVREKVSQIYKAGRSIASSEDKVTRCLITLDPQGNLLKVQVISDSGIHELDEAAIEAFKSAAPFPHPPKGIIDPDGNIKIRWDFILEA